MCRTSSYRSQLLHDARVKLLCTHGVKARGSKTKIGHRPHARLPQKGPLTQWQQAVFEQIVQTMHGYPRQPQPVLHCELLKVVVADFNAKVVMRPTYRQLRGALRGLDAQNPLAFYPLGKGPKKFGCLGPLDS